MDKNNKRIALITGATGGLGTAMCKELFKDGYHVLGNYRNKEKAQEWQQQLKADGVDVDIVEGDVCEFNSVSSMIKEIEQQYGTVDILVNNAGITRDGRLSKMSLDDWNAVINTNLNSVFNCTRQVIEA